MPAMLVMANTCFSSIPFQAVARESRPTACSNQYDQDIYLCSQQFEPPSVHANTHAFEECLIASQSRLDACFETINEDDNELAAIWNDSIQRVKECIDVFSSNPALVAACIDGKRQVLCHELELLTGNPDLDFCDFSSSETGLMHFDDPIITRSGRVHPAAPTTAFSKTVFIPTTEIKHMFRGIRRETDAAIGWLIYPTRDGLITKTIGGTPTHEPHTRSRSFTVNLAEHDLIDSNIVVFVLWRYGNDGLPIHTEHAVISIESPIGDPADWDRDGVVDASDFHSFIEAWRAGVPRADLSNNKVHDIEDIMTYAQSFAESTSLR